MAKTRSTGNGGRAVFLDRDGVIIEQVRHLRSPEQMRLLPGAARAISRLKAARLRVVVVTNQSAVARGYLTRPQLEGIHRRLRRDLAAEGARLDGIYYCPHHPRFGRRVRCACRKPRIGMLTAAARKLKLDLSRSFFVGDMTTDIRTARNAGCAAVLVRTGYGGSDGRYKAEPDKTCKDLRAAAAWILRSAKAAATLDIRRRPASHRTSP